jgi:acyl carrier protein
MTTFQKIAEIIAKVKKNRVEASAIKPESRLREDLDLDSIGLVEAIVLVEEAFTVKVSQDDVAYLKTVADVVAYIDTKLSK